MSWISSGFNVALAARDRHDIVHVDNEFAEILALFVSFLSGLLVQEVRKSCTASVLPILVEVVIQREWSLIPLHRHEKHGMIHRLPVSVEDFVEHSGPQLLADSLIGAQISQHVWS